MNKWKGLVPLYAQKIWVLKRTHLFIGYVCDQQVVELSTRLRLKTQSFQKNIIYLLNQIIKDAMF